MNAAAMNVGGLTVAGAASVSNGASVLADNANSGNFALNVAGSGGQSGQLALSGAGTALTTVGVSEIQSGTLTVSAGATLSCQNTAATTLALILDPPNPGAPASLLNVTGAGSRLAVTGDFISYYSPGETLSVAGGALATVSGDVIDAALNLVVDGAGSQLQVSGSLSSTMNDPLGGTRLTVTNAATATIGNGSHLTQLTLAGTLAATGNLQVDAASGSGTISTTGTLFGGGTIAASGGTLVVNGATLGGVLAVGGGSTLVLAGAGADISAMSFLAGGGTLVEANTAKLGAVSSFGVGDFIDLTGVAAASDSFANGTLTLLNAQDTAVGVLAFGSNYAAANFTLANDGHGGTRIGFH